MAKKKYYGKFVSFLLCLFITLFGFALGLGGLYFYKTSSEIAQIKVYTLGEISFHFLELGNENTGDCTYIKAGETDILIDAGSNYTSIPTITAYINSQVKDKKLEYVIVTHAHKDHYAGFATNFATESIFDKYDIGTIIDFAQTEKGNTSQDMYKNYQRELSEAVERGAKHYTALDCVNKTNGATNTYELSKDITMTILNQRFYAEQDKDNENNHSVCTLFTHGDKNFLFTGDLDKEGEESLVSLNNLPKCELYKAGHHGSKTSSNEVLLEKIQPNICCVCCCAGNVEYTQNLNNTFPTQDFINRISKYTDRVYVTTLGPIVATGEKNKDGSDKYKNDGHRSLNGNIVVTSTSSTTEVNCSNNNIKLKDTDWFKKYRKCPTEWVA